MLYFCCVNKFHSELSVFLSNANDGKMVVRKQQVRYLAIKLTIKPTIKHNQYAVDNTKTDNFEK